MKTTKNIIKGIKILANGPLYCAVLVAAGAHCIGSKKKISVIESTPREEKLILTDVTPDKDIPDEDDDLLEQPHVEQTCVVPTQPSNISHVALEGGNTTNQKLVPKENGGARSSGRLDQLNQSINSQSQIVPDALNKHAHGGNEVTQSDLQVHNSRLNSVQKNDNQEPSDLKNKIQTNTLSDQNISKKDALLQNFQQEMDALQEKAKSLEDKYRQEFRDKKSKKLTGLLAEMQNCFKENNFNDPSWRDRIMNIRSSTSEEKIKTFIELILKNTSVCIEKFHEELHRKIEDKKNKKNK